MTHPTPRIAIIGAGPAGLMAAEHLATSGLAVDIFDHMPSPGRKFLMAGRGGLNLTHSEPLEPFLARYRTPEIRRFIRDYPPEALIAWCEGLGQKTFIGSSGRVFPKAMKASPLLRAWLTRLGNRGVTLHTSARWTGWTETGDLAFADGHTQQADATILALGGASWPRLGADGGWAAILGDSIVTPLRPANCGFTVPWSAIFRARHAGSPLKRIALSFQGETVRGEAIITATGIEGGAVYALSAPLRDALPATLTIDLRPDLSAASLAAKLDAPRGGISLANHLRRAGLPPVAIGLVQEARHAGNEQPLSVLVKNLPITLTGTFPIDHAISTAGGVRWRALDENLMLRNRPGVFAAGEMLDWEAPTGGYLLQGCFATAVAAARGAEAWVK